MLNLSALLQRVFHLHAAVPQRIWGDRAFRPVHLFVEVTYRCNLRCNFCGYLDIIEGTVQHVGPKPGEYTREEIERRVDEFPFGRLISFAGGETLVRKDFPDILAHASRRHRTHVITNGSLITEDIARRYVDLAPRWLWQNGLVLVGVSMEGDEAQHDRVVGRRGSWRKTVAGVRHLVRMRAEAGKSFPKFNLKLAVTRDTAHGLVDFVRLAADLGVDIVNFLAEHDLVEHAGNLTDHTARSRMDLPQRKPEGVDPAQLREQLRAAYEFAESAGLEVRLTPHLPIEEFVRHYTDDRTLDASEYECGSAWSRMGLGADGRYSSGACNYLRCGDVRRDSMWDVWNNDETRALRADILKSKVFAGCNGCCNLKYVGPREFGLAGLDV